MSVLLNPPQPKKRRSNRDIERLQEELSERLGTKVEIKAGSKGSGKLVINYTSLDHLDEFLTKLKR